MEILLLALMALVVAIFVVVSVRATRRMDRERFVDFIAPSAEGRRARIRRWGGAGEPPRPPAP